MSGYSAIIIDGRNLLHRASHGGKDLTTEINGVDTPIGAVYQFIRSATLLYDTHAAKGAALFTAWEGDRDHSWRRDLFPDYKAGREPDEDLDAQERLLRTVLVRCGWSQVWSPGHEADDTAATLAALLVDQVDGKVAIVTGDHDLHQCVTDRVHVVDPNAQRYDLVGDAWKLRDVLHRWGVEPDMIPAVKALMGDKSDGVPGATGIGKMWATGLVQGYSENAGLDAAIMDGQVEIEVDGKTKRSKAKAKTLAEERDAIEMYRDIVTVRVDAPLEFAPRRYDADKVRNLFRGLKFASLLSPSTLSSVGRMAGVQRHRKS